MGDPLSVAKHEAGHAVVQWFVGWEDQIDRIEMRWIGDQATDGAMKPVPKYASGLGALRAFLLILWAGAATTGKNDFDKDLRQMILAMRPYLGFPPIGIASINPVRLEPDEADALLQDARMRASEVVRFPPVAAAIDAVARQLCEAQPDEIGYVHVSGVEIVATCNAHCDEAARRQNEWLDWLAG